MKLHRTVLAFVTQPPLLIGPNRLFVVEVDGSGLREVHTTSNDIGGFPISGDGQTLAWVEGFFDSSLGSWTYNDIWVADLVALVGPAPLSPNADLTNTVRVVVE